MNLRQVRPLVDQRLKILQSLDLRQIGQATGQSEEDLAGLALRNQALSILQAMETEEQQLLEQRESISARTYREARFVLAGAFAAVLALLSVNFRRLLIELRDRTQAEEAVRTLSAKILQVQDAERRKVTRELHDSIGQIFAALRMNLSTVQDSGTALEQGAKNGILASSLELVDQGLTECRTLSHLLHPPLLEDVGFTSAAKWLVEGFAKRSRIAVNLDIPDDLPRLPPEVELALFRVLQEGLTNVHRHSGSASADAVIRATPSAVLLSVRDHGKGIPLEKLEGFKKNGAGVGVGLAGMRERIREIKGQLEINSRGNGTILRVKVPLARTGL